MSVQQMQALADRARQLLEAKAAAMVMLGDLNRKLEELRDEMVAAGAEAGGVWDMPDGEVKLEPGRVTTRRGVDTRWLDDHFEDLPADVRELVDVKETATVDLGKAPERLAMELSASASLNEASSGWLKVDRKSVWPKVSDLEERLPPEVAEHAITRQVRDKPVLVFEQRGIAVGQNDRA